MPPMLRSVSTVHLSLEAADALVPGVVWALKMGSGALVCVRVAWRERMWWREGGAQILLEETLPHFLTLPCAHSYQGWDAKKLLDAPPHILVVDEWRSGSEASV